MAVYTHYMLVRLFKFHANQTGSAHRWCWCRNHRIRCQSSSTEGVNQGSTD